MSSDTTSAPTVPVAEAVTRNVRVALAITGVLTLIAGILILVWPGQTVLVATAVIAIYAIINGLVYAGIGIFGKAKSGWSRVGHILLGLVFVVSGVIAFFNLAATGVWLAIFLATLVGIMWIVEGVVAFTTIGDSTSKVWTVLFAVLSIIAGIMLLLNPIWGTAVIVLMLGISAIVLGVVQIVRAFTFGK